MLFLHSLLRLLLAVSDSLPSRGLLGVLGLHQAIQVSKSMATALDLSIKHGGVSKWMLHEEHRPFGEPTRGSLGVVET
jgi:hypothetical protein